MAHAPVEQALLVGIPQIAEIAGVGRSAVSNWRKRHPAFPTPKVQAPSGALFDLREIEDWLIEEGKISRRASASTRLFALADAARGPWTPQQFVRFCVSCLVYFEVCARARGDAPGQPMPRIPRGASWSDVRSSPPAEFLAALTEAARAIEAANPELEGLLDPRLDQDAGRASDLAQRIAIALDGVTDEVSDRPTLFEDLTDVEALDRFSGEFATPADVASLVARLVAADGGTILDPAVGEGRLLQQTAVEGGDAAAGATLVGVDVNWDSSRRSRARFYLNRREAEIHQRNSLTADPDTLPRADIVVADPPYGMGNWGDADLYVDPRWRFGPPPPRSADFAWLQLATLQLTPTGRAAVLMDEGSLFRGGPEAAIRQKMVDAGVVEAVLVLPPRLRTNTSIALSLWLLRSPAAPSAGDDILFVDAAALGATGRSRYSLPESSIAALVALVNRWRQTRDISGDDAVIAASASPGVVLAAEGNLSPRRYLSSPGLDIGALQAQVDELRQSFGESSAAAARANADLLGYLEDR